MITRNRLYLVPSPEPSADETSWSDVWLLVLLFVLHAIPVSALAAGLAWGTGLQGYSTAVALVTGRELVRELRGNLRARALPRARA